MYHPIRAMRVPPKLWEAVRAVAAADGVSASEVLRTAAATYGPVRHAIDNERTRRATPTAEVH